MPRASADLVASTLKRKRYPPTREVLQGTRERPANFLVPGGESDDVNDGTRSGGRPLRPCSAHRPSARHLTHRRRRRGQPPLNLHNLLRGAMLAAG